VQAREGIEVVVTATSAHSRCAPIAYVMYSYLQFDITCSSAY